MDQNSWLKFSIIIHSEFFSTSNVFFIICRRSVPIFILSLSLKSKISWHIGHSSSNEGACSRGSFKVIDSSKSFESFGIFSLCQGFGIYIKGVSSNGFHESINNVSFTSIGIEGNTLCTVEPWNSLFPVGITCFLSFAFSILISA